MHAIPIEHNTFRFPPMGMTGTWPEPLKNSVEYHLHLIKSLHTSVQNPSNNHCVLILIVKDQYRNHYRRGFYEHFDSKTLVTKLN